MNSCHSLMNTYTFKLKNFSFWSDIHLIGKSWYGGRVCGNAPAPLPRIVVGNYVERHLRHCLLLLGPKKGELKWQLNSVLSYSRYTNICNHLYSINLWAFDPNCKQNSSVTGFPNVLRFNLNETGIDLKKQV